MNDELEKKILALENWKKSLENSQSIPLNVNQAFARRLTGNLGLSSSSKSNSSENQAVNEGGAATYNVLKSPDGFLQITIDGTTYYIPYFG